MALLQLEGGGFQDVESNPLANGFLFLQLSGPATDSTGTIQICNDWVLEVPLDANGNIFGGDLSTFVWANDQMVPNTTFYLAWVESSTGQLSWGPNAVTITGSSPFNLGNWVPAIPA